MTNETVVTGGSFPFHVECRNAAGRLVVPKDCTVTTPEVVGDPGGTSLGNATVESDGSNGVFTSTNGPGQINIIAKAGGVDSPPFTVDIVEDTAITSVTVVSDAIAAVKIKRG